MPLFKEKDVVAKKNCQKKSLRFRTFIFHFAWRAKLHAEFQRLSASERVTQFFRHSPIFHFRPILGLLIQLRALRGISMTQCTRTFLRITCSMVCSGFGKRKFDRNCIDAVYSRTSRSLILTTIMWLVLCALNIIDMTFFLLN